MFIFLWLTGPKERKKPRKKDANKSDADTIETDPKATPDGKTAGKRNKPKTESGNKNDTISDDVNGDTTVSAKTSGDVKETVNGNGEVDDSSPAAKKKPPNPEDKDNSAERKEHLIHQRKLQGMAVQIQQQKKCLIYKISKLLF